MHFCTSIANYLIVLIHAKTRLKTNNFLFIWISNENKCLMIINLLKQMSIVQALKEIYMKNMMIVRLFQNIP